MSADEWQQQMWNNIHLTLMSQNCRGQNKSLKSTVLGKFQLKNFKNHNWKSLIFGKYFLLEKTANGCFSFITRLHHSSDWNFHKHLLSIHIFTICSGQKMALRSRGFAHTTALGSRKYFGVHLLASVKNPQASVMFYYVCSFNMPFTLGSQTSFLAPFAAFSRHVVISNVLFPFSWALDPLVSQVTSSLPTAHQYLSGWHWQWWWFKSFQPLLHSEHSELVDSSSPFSSRVWFTISSIQYFNFRYCTLFL